MNWRRHWFNQAPWRNGLNFPVYVPPDMGGIKALLSTGQVSETCTKLWSLSQLGSDSAAALLGFMAFRGVDWTGADQSDISERCRQAAFRGNEYAQYVMAMHERRLGDYAKEWTWLAMANKSQFGASLSESARLAVTVIGKPDLALPYIKRGLRIGHIPSLIFFLNLSVRGSYGMLWQVLAVLFLPFAFLVMTLGVWFFPYSQKVFVHLENRKGGLFG